MCCDPNQSPAATRKKVCSPDQMQLPGPLTFVHIHSLSLHTGSKGSVGHTELGPSVAHCLLAGATKSWEVGRLSKATEALCAGLLSQLTPVEGASPDKGCSGEHTVAAEVAFRESCAVSDDTAMVWADFNARTQNAQDTDMLAGHKHRGGSSTSDSKLTYC
jgi:hypothetical protein